MIGAISMLLCFGWKLMPILTSVFCISNLQWYSPFSTQRGALSNGFDFRGVQGVSVICGAICLTGFRRCTTFNIPECVARVPVSLWGSGG